MNETEFTALAKRVSVAFGIPNVIPLQIDITEDEFGRGPSETCYEISARTGDLYLDVWFYEMPDTWGFAISERDPVDKELRCFGWPERSELDWRNRLHTDPWFTEQATTMTRALYRLGFDTSLIETEFGLTITAHEKIEWIVEFSRE
jgi:hypothetical protein